MRKYTRCKDMFFFSHAPFKPYLSVRRGQLWKPTVWDRHCGCVRPGTLIPVPTLSVSPQCRKKKTGDIRWQFVIWKAQDDIGKDWLSRILANCLWFARRRSLLWEHVMYTCITNELFFYRWVHGVLPSFDCAVRACVCKIGVTCSFLFNTWPLIIWHAQTCVV